jgi:hypothetical protein
MGKATQSQSQASPRAKNSSRLAQPACAEPRPGAVTAGTTAGAVPLTEQGFRFALDPTAEQARVLNCWLGASRYWYNAGLAEVKTRLDKRAKADEEARSAIKLPWSYKGLCSVITASIRNEAAPWQRELPCGTYMAAFDGLGAALQKALDEASAQGLTGLVIMRPAGKAGKAGKAGQSVVSPLPEWVRGATDLGDTNLVDDQATAMNRNTVIVTAGEPACQ